MLLQSSCVLIWAIVHQCRFKYVFQLFSTVVDVLTSICCQGLFDKSIILYNELEKKMLIITV